MDILYVKSETVCYTRKSSLLQVRLLQISKDIPNLYSLNDYKYSFVLPVHLNLKKNQETPSLSGRTIVCPIEHVGFSNILNIFCTLPTLYGVGLLGDYDFRGSI